eukprot:CAMPEP_0116560554 /NCGR_PEP_ID=MMETSP0397-20121206/11063_1 /TAXON_ID=216820 /ORGANISM="Cyclophora tenuis, Strain ECT3854" /LENGTH=105 /DNA_ID=CAMNT_0004086541 /DNA_START=1 /DNA_END=318 /DNA_ORIENTATION=-
MTSIGVLLVLHSAFSCQQYRGLVSSMPSELVSIPPTDVVVEVGLGFLLCLVGQLVGVGSVRPIVGPKHKPIVAPPYQTRDFDKYNHRLQALRKQQQQQQQQQQQY